MSTHLDKDVGFSIVVSDGVYGVYGVTHSDVRFSIVSGGIAVLRCVTVCCGVRPTDR